MGKEYISLTGCVFMILGAPPFLSGSKCQLGRCLTILAQEETNGLMEQERRPRQTHVDARKCRIKVGRRCANYRVGTMRNPLKNENLVSPHTTHKHELQVD